MIQVKKKNNEINATSSLRLHSSSNVVICFKQPPNQLLRLQQFLGVTLISFIFGDNLRCYAGRLSLLFSLNSSITLGTCCSVCTRKHISPTLFMSTIYKTQGGKLFCSLLMRVLLLLELALVFFLKRKG